MLILPGSKKSKPSDDSSKNPGYSDDYFGFSDGACHTYNVTKTVEGITIEGTFVTEVEKIQEPAAPAGLEILKITQSYSSEALGPSLVNYYGKVKDSSGDNYYYYMLTTESGYKISYDEDDLIFVAPLKIGDKYLGIEIIREEEATVPFGSFTAFVARQKDSEIDATGWIVPYLGTVKSDITITATFEGETGTIEMSMELTSYTRPE